MINTSKLNPLLRQVLAVATFLFCLVILAFSLRGIKGNPSAAELNHEVWKDEGPLELSPERGRFALTYSLLEDHSFSFSLPVAEFAMPDVAQADGKYVSLFAPTVSYLIMPGYILGKMWGVSQVGSFAMIALFAAFNFVLIRKIALLLGAQSTAASIAGLLFVFATPAFPYAVTLYQHHISTFVILLSIYTLIRWKNIWSLAIVWFLCALSISIDNPNLFLMLPIGLFALGRVFQIEEKVKNYQITLRLAGIISLVVMIIPLGFFMYFNKMSYGNPFQLAGTVASGAGSTFQTQDVADVINEELASKSGEVDAPKRSAIGFFKPRNLPHGLYEHFLSFDRGMILYTPVILVGFLGLWVLVKTKPDYARLLLAIVGMDALLYSMWGDPYGGWAFGSRYMIPAYAILAILLALVLTRWRKKIIFLFIVLGLGLYSTGVNTIGALTSNRNPPKVEILSLEAITNRRERYTFTRNMEMLNANKSKSFIFQETKIHDSLTAWQYASVIIGAIGIVLGLHFVALYLSRKS